MIVSPVSMMATSHQDWDLYVSANASAMLMMDMIEIARMKNSYVVLFRSPRSVLLGAVLTEFDFVRPRVVSCIAGTAAARRFRRRHRARARPPRAASQAAPR